MSRLRAARDPVYRRRALQFAADALLAAIAFALAFKLRFLDASGGIPDRYWTMLTGTVVFVAVGKAIVFSVLGLHGKWWRYFQLPDLWPVRPGGCSGERAPGGGVHPREALLVQPAALGRRLRLPAHGLPARGGTARAEDGRRAAQPRDPTWPQPRRA